MSELRCRSCTGSSLRVFLSLGETPLADALLDDEALARPEPQFSLDVAFCPDCSLVQIVQAVPPERLFVDNYLYFSSFSPALTAHAKAHAEKLIRRQGLGAESLVVELASNDGYLLRNFVDRGVPVLGIDPAPDQAEAAEAIGVPTIPEFFGVELAERLRLEGRAADVIIANNVMAHVPDLNGFVEGMRVLLAEDGVATIENPYVRDLIDNVEFDTIYHEHHCYFSCTAVDALMRRHGLHLNDVEYFPDLHGGTLRWSVAHHADVSDTVQRYLADEQAAGLDTFGYYDGFGQRVERLRDDLRELLESCKAEGATIAAYGAAAKGSTMVNYAGIGVDFIDYVVDRNTYKQGHYMPGVHLPIRDPAVLLEEQPDYLLLLAWNFADEIMEQQAEYRRRGGRFIVPVPAPAVL